MKYSQSGNADREVSTVCFGACAAGGWIWYGKKELKQSKLSGHI